jgi:hypothetical protein
MNASTRPMFTIAGCMLAAAAVGGIVACLVVLLLWKRKERVLR